MTRASRIRLLVFLVVGGLAVVNAGARYAGLTERLFPSTYAVTVHLADSGGLFERGEVTYRGVTVGRVESLDFRTDGVDARLAIDDGERIPADVEAEVHNRSAVGEQYLDLVPRTGGGPYLADGAVIDVADTSTPLDEERLILDADRLLRSVDRRDLRTVVDESGKALAGAGPDLGRLLGNGRTVLDAARHALPATRTLLRTGHTVLLTQDDQAATIAGYLHDLDGLTGVVAVRDDSLRTVLRDATGAARQLRLLGLGLEPVLPGLLTRVSVISAITSRHRDDLEEGLVAIPYALASAITPGRDGRAHFTFVGATGPGPCRRGYLPVSRWKSPQDPRHSILPADIGCHESSSSVPRGAQTVR